MRLQDLLPRVLRMIQFYAKSKKISASKNLSEEKKVASILKAEKFWIDDITKVFKGGTGIQDQGIAVGAKDIASIYLNLNRPEDALRFLNAIKDAFPAIVEYRKNDALINAFILSLLYEGQAHAILGRTGNCKDAFDTLNIRINDLIANDPSNSNLQELYTYCNRRIFNIYLKIAELFPGQKSEAYSTCYKQLNAFLKRDPGNSQLEELVNRFE